MERIASPVRSRARPPTFMRLPLDRDPTARDLVVLGVPYDESGRCPGTRLGPDAVRSVSALAHVPGADRGPGTFDLVDCVDGGDVDLTPPDPDTDTGRGPGGVPETLYRRLSHLLTGNATVLLLGGGRSLTVAALRAVAERHGPVALLHLAADPAEDHPEDEVRCRAVQEHLVDPSAVVRIGLRGGGAPDRAGGAATLDVGRFGRLGVRGAAGVVRHRIGRRPVYVSVAVDVADPAFAPGTGTRVPGGLTSREILGVLRCVGDLCPVGFEVTGVSPPQDRSGITAALAAEIAGELIHEYARAQRIPM
ncbi:arginase family protein [Streptomyces sp. NPDC006296]|uniref:arginase family protein n=1 Tax=Streptomyces sp. NPDC006296 TaxID=3156746 RepID=UPI0033B44CDF